MILIVLAGAAVAFFIWKRKGSTPAAGFGGGASGRPAVDTSVGGDAGTSDTPARAAQPGFGGGTSTATGTIPTTRTTTTRTPAPVNAPVSRGTPPKASGVPTSATQPAPAPSPYVKAGANALQTNAILNARLRTQAAHL